MQRYISIVLSFLILLSSSGLAYAKHYCGSIEMVSKVTLGEAHLSCGMVMASTPCGDEHEEEGHFCCSNKYLKVTTDDQYAKVAFDFDFTTQWFVTIVEVFVPRQLELPAEHNVSYRYYRPPPLEKDYQVLFETFLI